MSNANANVDLKDSLKEIRDCADARRVSEAASICYLVHEYCMDENNDFFNPSVIADAMEVVHDLLCFGENL